MAAVLMAQGPGEQGGGGSGPPSLANGDTANKVGTYGVAVAAAYHRRALLRSRASVHHRPVPGKGGPNPHRIPGRAGRCRGFQGAASAPPAVETFNPAFDVTPARLIAGIITEEKIYRPKDGKFDL